MHPYELWLGCPWWVMAACPPDIPRTMEHPPAFRVTEDAFYYYVEGSGIDLSSAFPFWLSDWSWEELLPVLGRTHRIEVWHAQKHTYECIPLRWDLGWQPSILLSYWQAWHDLQKRDWQRLLRLTWRCCTYLSSSSSFHYRILKNTHRVDALGYWIPRMVSEFPTFYKLQKADDKILERPQSIRAHHDFLQALGQTYASIDCLAVYRQGQRKCYPSMIDFMRLKPESVSISGWSYVHENTASPLLDLWDDPETMLSMRSWMSCFSPGFWAYAPQDEIFPHRLDDQGGNIRQTVTLFPWGMHCSVHTEVWADVWSSLLRYLLFQPSWSGILWIQSPSWQWSGYWQGVCSSMAQTCLKKEDTPSSWP